MFLSSVRLEMFLKLLLSKFRVVEVWSEKIESTYTNNNKRSTRRDATPGFPSLSSCHGMFSLDHLLDLGVLPSVTHLSIAFRYPIQASHADAHA